MNIVTYKRYPKKLDDIKSRLIETINSCQDEGQLASALNFNSGYINAVDHFKHVRYQEVSDKMIVGYCKKQNGKKR